MRRRLLLVGKNLGVLLASHAINRLLYLVLLVAIGRLLGAEVLGGYALAGAVGAVFLFATDLGLSPRLTREAAAHPTEAAGHYARASGVKLAAGGLALASIPVLRAALPYQPWVLDLCGLMTVAAVLESFSQLNNAVCRSYERMELEAVAAGTQAVVAVGGSLWILFNGLPPVFLGWAAVAGSAAELVVSALLARQFVRLGVVLPPRWSTLRAASPYAVSSLNAVSFFQAELVVLSLIVDQVTLGQFAAVSRLLQGGGYVAFLAGSSILPTLTIAHGAREREAFRTIGSSLLRTSMLGGGGMAAIALSMAHPIIVAIYGSGFAALAPLLRLGGLYLLVKCVSEALSALLTASGGQARSAASRVLGAASTWGFILLLTPGLGVTGAVLALAVGEAVTCLWQGTRLRDLAHPAPLVSAAMWLVAALGVATGAWIWLEAGGFPGLAVVSPPLLFGALLLVSGQVRLRPISGVPARSGPDEGG